MRILVVGSGGREHALAWKLAQCSRVKKVFVAPGNGGVGEVAECLPLAADKTVELADFTASSNIDLTVVGPENPLVYGIVDYFRERKLPIFGPTKAAARLEGSKAFSKQLMQEAGVPTAAFETFTDVAAAEAYLKSAPVPIVVKADGLAAGKGAVVAHSREEALAALHSMLRDRVFGEAGGRVVIEDYLEGEEVSVLGILDGDHALLLEPSQDHKRAFDGDQGPNTGGMGAICPVPRVDPALLAQIRTQIFEPVLRRMRMQGTPFQGILYAGLMLTPEGPKVLEFNVRFGDPETQTILPRLKNDFADLLMGAVEGRLNRFKLEWDPRAAACVVLASEGYPGKYDLGREITGLRDAADLPNAVVFHAGTRREGNRVLTSGGRVLNVVGLGDTLEAAVHRAYEAAEKIQFHGKQFRTDIGARALKCKPCAQRS